MKLILNADLLAITGKPVLAFSIEYYNVVYTVLTVDHKGGFVQGLARLVKSDQRRR